MSEEDKCQALREKLKAAEKHKTELELNPLGHHGPAQAAVMQELQAAIIEINRLQVELENCEEDQ